MTSSSPSVSVLVTAYNRESVVGDAIESVLNSSLRDIEIIVVDDASSDRTAERARTYAVSDSRVRVYANDTNLGDYANRNRAASYARGTYLKYVDSDDVIYPHGLEVMVGCMKAFPEAGLGLSNVPDPLGPCPRLLSSREAYLENFFQHDILSRAPGSTIIRRRAFEAAGGFSGKRYIGDHELWLKLARMFPIVKMPTDLLWDRQHPDQEKHNDGDRQVILQGDARIAALHASDCPLDVSECAAALKRVEIEQARLYWSLVVAQGPRAANRYRRGARVPIGSITKSLVSRLRQFLPSAKSAASAR